MGVFAEDSITVPVLRADLRYILDAIKDAQRELEQDEVAELTSAALDRKLEKAVKLIEDYRGK
jgi:hypothetical protein